MPDVQRSALSAQRPTLNPVSLTRLAGAMAHKLMTTKAVSFSVLTRVLDQGVVSPKEKKYRLQFRFTPRRFPQIVIQNLLLTLSSGCRLPKILRKRAR